MNEWEQYGTYGDQEAYATGMRTSYGAQAHMYAQAAFASTQTTVGGAATGVHNMLSQMGSHIMPITYTPPAQVVSGYGGGYMQKTGMINDIRTMAGWGQNPAGTRPSQLMYNAGTDLGERAGLAGLGAMSGAASVGVGLATMGMGLVPGLGVGMAATHLAERVLAGVEQRREVSNYLGNTSYSYVGAGNAASDPRKGGFNAAARNDIGDFIRKSSMNDMQMEFGDYQNVLKGGTEMGMFAGTSGVEDFKKKFKSLVTNVKVVSQTLNQSLEEAMKTMKELKGIGVEGSAATAMATGASVYGAASGRTGAEMMGLALQGAEMFRGTGVSMSIGAASNMMNATSIRASRDAGLLSQEAIAQAGGEEALAQRMTGNSMQFMQSGMGRGLAASYATGGAFNANAFQSAMYGGGSVEDAAQRAAVNMAGNSAGNYMKFIANQGKFQSELGKSFGGNGLQISQMSGTMMGADYLRQGIGKDNLSQEDAYRAQAKRQNPNATDASIDAELAGMRGANGVFAASAAATSNAAAMNKEDAIARNGKFRQVLKGVGRTLDRFVDPVSEVGADFLESARDVGRDTSDWYNNIHRADSSKLMAVSSKAAGMDMSASEVNRIVDKAMGKDGLPDVIAAHTRKGDASTANLLMSDETAKNAASESDVGKVSAAVRKKKYSSIQDMSQDVFGKNLLDLTRDEMAALKVGSKGSKSASEVMERATEGAQKRRDQDEIKFTDQERVIIDKVASAEKAVSTAIGGKVTPEMVSAMASGTDEEIDKAFAAAGQSDRLGELGGASGLRADKNIRTAVSDWKGPKDEQTAFLIKRGQQAMSGAVGTIEDGLKTKEERETFRGYKDKYLTTGQAADMQGLAGDSGAKKFFNEHNAGHLVKIAEQVNDGAKTDAAGAQTSLNELLVKSASKNNVAGETGGAYGGMNDKGAMDATTQALDTQMNVNLEILAVMRAMADRLKN